VNIFYDAKFGCLHITHSNYRLESNFELISGLY
jgi:hypothetical protein